MKKQNRQEDHWRAKMKALSAFGSFNIGKCPKCGSPLFYAYRYDTECCFLCDAWMSDNCGDPNCPFCAERPEVPSLVVWEAPEIEEDPKQTRRERYQRKTAGTARKHGQKQTKQEH